MKPNHSDWFKTLWLNPHIHIPHRDEHKLNHSDWFETLWLNPHIHIPHRGEHEPNRTDWHQSLWPSPHIHIPHRGKPEVTHKDYHETLWANPHTHIPHRRNAESWIPELIHAILSPMHHAYSQKEELHTLLTNVVAFVHQRTQCNVMRPLLTRSLRRINWIEGWTSTAKWPLNPKPLREPSQAVLN